MSLISLNNQGDNSGGTNTATRFRNYFRSPLIIPPGSKLKFIGTRLQKQNTIEFNLTPLQAGEGQMDNYPMAIWYRYGSGRTKNPIQFGSVEGGAPLNEAQNFYVNVPRYANINQNEDFTPTYPNGIAEFTPQELGSVIAEALNQDLTIPAFMSGGIVPTINSNLQLNRYDNIYSGANDGVGSYIHYNGQNDTTYEMLNLYNTIYQNEFNPITPSYLRLFPYLTDAGDFTIYNVVDGEAVVTYAADATDSYGQLTIEYQGDAMPITERSGLLVGNREVGEAGSMIWARQPGTFINFEIDVDDSGEWIDCAVGLTSPHWVSWMENPTEPDDTDDKDYYPNPKGRVYQYHHDALPMWFYVTLTAGTLKIYACKKSPALAMEDKEAGSRALSWIELYSEVIPAAVDNQVRIKICQPMGGKKEPGDYYNLEVYLADMIEGGSEIELWGSTIQAHDGKPVTLNQQFSYPSFIGTLQPMILVGPSTAAGNDNTSYIYFAVQSNNWDGTDKNTESGLTSGSPEDGARGGLIKGPIPLAGIPQWDYDGNGLFGDLATSFNTNPMPQQMESERFRDEEGFNIDVRQIEQYNPQQVGLILFSILAGSADTIQDPVPGEFFNKGPSWIANVQLQINTNASDEDPSGGVGGFDWQDTKIWSNLNNYPLKEIGEHLGLPNAIVKYDVFDSPISGVTYPMYSYLDKLKSIASTSIFSRPVHIQITNLPIRSWNGTISNLCKDIAVCFLNRDADAITGAGYVEYEAPYPVEIALNNKQTITLQSMDVLITYDNNKPVQNLTGVTEIVLQLVYPDAIPLN